MNRFDWDGLRLGDPVFVHDRTRADGPADRGDVIFVTVRSHRRGNEVGVKLDGDGTVVWPSWNGVHRDAVAAAGECWRCDANSAAAASA